MSHYAEFPRLLYRGDGSDRRLVKNDDDKAAALAEGYRLTKDAAPEGPDEARAPVDEAEFDAAPPAAPKKRGRKPKAD